MLSGNITITEHAIEQFQRRSGLENRTRAIQTLESFLNNSKQIFLKKQFIPQAIIDHNFREAEYRECNGWIMVLVDNALVTIHSGEAEHWDIRRRERKRGRSPRRRVRRHHKEREKKRKTRRIEKGY